MTSVRKTSFYDFVFTDLADPRTNDWFLVASPLPLLAIIGTYLLCVTTLGPWTMRKRKPIEMNSVLIFYNFLQVLVSVALVYEALDGVVLRSDFSWGCQPLIEEATREALREARCVYLYFLAKITELLDTVFFVLRKKGNQVTFLHTYHHAIMPVLSWGFVKYCPGGHVLFSVGLNSFVHIIMYSYYMLAACGPQLQKYLWWKKYITLLQMVQFIMICLHDVQLLYTECSYPRFSLLFTLTNSVLFFFLFNNFYGNAYKGERIGNLSHQNSPEKYKAK